MKRCIECLDTFPDEAKGTTTNLNGIPMGWTCVGCQIGILRIGGLPPRPVGVTKMPPLILRRVAGVPKHGVAS